ncbi:MAG TPA: serine/threonine-protein kinase [Polyangium sp.]|nr:serine/threonine-protein kinase [Polyangium sp.]
MTAPQLSPGYVIAGKYSVQALLGYGGSSATYRVVDATGNAFAVRIYAPTIAQRPEVMAMIEQIYSATNGMPPDGVLPVLDAGYDPQTAAPFTATEYSAAPSLGQLVSQRPLQPHEVAQIAQNLARVLEQAHARQLMHHALKPSNVFVSPQGFAVRVMDFGAGLARSYEQTNEGYAIAAPWVAPEQMQGSAPAGAPADVFAMGLLLFYALTGRPYWRSCQTAQPDFGAWQQELVGPRVPSSQRAIEVGAQVSPVLDAVFTRALAIDPNERFRQVGDLAAAFAAAANMPDSAVGATVAFPAIPDPMGPTAAAPVYQPPGQDGGGYPPAANMGMGMGGPGQDMGQGMGMGGQGMGMGGPAMGNPGMGAPSFDPAGGGGRSKTPIIIGAVVVGVLLIGGLVFALTGKKTEEGDKPIEVAATSAGASNSPPPEPPPTTPASAEAPPPPAGEGEVMIKCSPACDEIKIDDNKIDDVKKPTKIAAGTHKVSLSKSGYQSQEEEITVEAGKKFEKEYKLAKDATASSTPPPPTTKSTGPGPTGTGKKPPPTKCVPTVFKRCPK